MYNKGGGVPVAAARFSEYPMKRYTEETSTQTVPGICDMREESNYNLVSEIYGMETAPLVSVLNSEIVLGERYQRHFEALK